MKEPLMHRIDILMEQAKGGNAEAQLKLAKAFTTGRLVEKSKDNALYWAFKAASGGNKEAVSYYNRIAYK